MLLDGIVSVRGAANTIIPPSPADLRWTWTLWNFVPPLVPNVQCPTFGQPLVFRHFDHWFEGEQAVQHVVLGFLRPGAVAFPKQDHRDRNSHPFGQFGLFRALFETCCGNAVTERFQGCRKCLFGPRMCRDDAAWRVHRRNDPASVRFTARLDLTGKTLPPVNPVEVVVGGRWTSSDTVPTPGDRLERRRQPGNACALGRGFTYARPRRSGTIPRLP